ncbi:dihydrofolate synthase [Sugiyamaella lignohabitans]|uniref:Dihydrofolate synthetase n=1 Tax=Sugiyamaella lignohabitans TaxID=796027 RepID=A0A161HHH5_9ASCO|nr:dihydrofolate synthase [Sugiyamaella lignohabitans]ANB11607.1 dihydrofolate synthase [Sugiyamaella lignohabitans]
MIDLGLSRVIRLLTALGNPQLTWKAVHVAGTNGKGSVCAYISSCITQAKISNGRFTSPHLVDRFDCISINGKPVVENLFLEVEKKVSEVNLENNIQATDFELLTAIAFEIFHRQKVDLAVIEVGLGGRLDATNVLPPSQTLCSIITKIGLDHQNFLGNTLSEIAREKAGIIKQAVPCILDATNEPEVIREVEKIVSQNNSKLILAHPLTNKTTGPFQVDPSTSPLLGSYQMSNLSCSLQALLEIQKHYPLSDRIVQQGIKETQWPGRLQKVQLSNGFEVLLDGAHNNQAADLLAEYINNSVRPSATSAITFIVAFSQGKDFKGILQRLVKPGDTVIATQFGAVDGMPWVAPCDPQEIAAVAYSFTDPANVHIEQSIQKGLSRAQQTPTTSSTVICGSLYLVADFVRATR